MTKSTEERYFHNYRSEMLRFVPSNAQRVLDVGCYSGAFGELLKEKRQIEIWGVEPNSSAATQAGIHLDHVICGYFSEALPIPDAYFDAVVMNDVLEHMSDPWAALALAKRKLTKNGRIVISLPNIRHVDNLLHILLEKDFRYEKTGIRDSTHLRFFTIKSAIRLIEESGLIIEKFEGIYELWWTKSIFRRIAYRLFSEQLEDTKYVQFALVAKKA